MKKSILIFSLLIASLSFFVVSCKKDKPTTEDPTTTIPMGTVTGKVTAANGTTAIPNANIFVDSGGEIYFTQSNREGVFSLSAPAGTQVLNVQSGSGRIFRAQYSVVIPENGTVQVPANTLLLTQSVNLAYITGLYDDIQSIIIDSLGYTATPITVADLSNLTLMQTFGAIFLNCGKSGLMDAQKYQNLKDYVDGGGCLYASDWAVEYLTGDGNMKTSGHKLSGHAKTSCATGMIGGFIEDSTLCTSKIGLFTTLYNTQVIAPDLQGFLGKTNVDVAYDLDGWDVIQQIESPWEVLVQDATNGNGPLAARLYVNSTNKYKNITKDGTWVTICHIPPGNPGNAHTITINSNALQAHLAHGDYLGSCNSGGTNGGVIYFTTFHNKPQGVISNDIQHLLEYFILNM
ncbi:MAG: carboxypeptidase regulatory-like domain-containing protein [Bacteroidetes bacterium]|nr:carboxypeptidase regulatory-like domain-containing protein [Bacteroidota bacterium]